MTKKFDIINTILLNIKHTLFTMNISGLYKKHNKTHYLIDKNSVVDITNIIEGSTTNILYNDIILLKNNIISVIKHSYDIIPGILHISSKVSYGVTGKGNIIKKFTPYDNIYPSFLVSTKKPFQSCDMYVTIKFDKWKNNICHGSITDYIGNVGDMSTEKKYILSCAVSSHTNIKKLNMDIYNDTIKNRIDLRKEIIYTIDPVGCKDVDDALHVKQLDNGYEIGIHIADVSAFIPPNSPLDIEIKNRCESIYLSDTQINMLPDCLSTDKLSLIESIDKATYSIIINLDKDYNIVDHKFCRTIINVKENMSYDKAQKIIDNKDIKFEPLILLYDIAHKLHIKTSANTFDTHKMVEIYMIMANSLAAKQLYKLYNAKALVRKHKINDKLSTNIKNYDILPSYVQNKILLFNYEKAEYSFANDDFKHSGLGEEYYTHFTSPIRRYADIIVHRMLTQYSIDNIPDSGVLFNINYVHNKTKKCYIKNNILLKITKMSSEIIDTSGYITGIKNYDIRIYIPSLDMDVDVNVCPDKLKHLVEIKECDNSIIISSTANNNIINIYVGQKIKLVVAVTLKDHKKLKIKIVEPDMQELFGEMDFEEL